MVFMVGIDTGGTFTDGFFTRDGDIKTAKVLTTPHDLTVCLADCVSEGARQFGVSVQDMLADTDIIRYSTTVSVNTIIQRAGAKIGLLVSQGFKDSLYSNSAEEADVAAVLSEEPDGSVEVSLRAAPGWDVTQVAAQFGGGGHALAAGCLVDGPLGEAERRVVSALQATLAAGRESSDRS